MDKTLVILESETKAKHVKEILGHGYETMATAGHICNIPVNGSGANKDDIGVRLVLIYDKSGRPSSFKIEIDIKVDPNRYRIVKALKEKASSVDRILLAADPDREGESIAEDVSNIVGRLCNNIRRVEFHAITHDEVLKAIKEEHFINKDKVNAQRARRALDRVIGFRLSQFANKTIRRENGTKPLSVGRVQSAVVRLIWDRENEIRNFKPLPFWKILFTDEKGTVFSSKNFEKEDDALRLLEAFSKNKKIVKSVDEAQKNEGAPKPLTASSMQQTCFKTFHWKPAKTMEVAQELFESGHISYPRTDSIRFSDETTQIIRTYLGKTGTNLLPETPVKHKNNNKVQDAHEALHPAHMDIGFEPEKMSSRFISTSRANAEEQKMLYTLIWNYAMASQCNPAIWKTISVKVTAGTDDVLSCDGKTLLSKGWRYFIPAADKIMPEYRQNESLSGSVEKKQDFTKPPARYNTGSIVKTMETLGIGRPSTYASTISNILERYYVREEGKEGSFFITERGETIVKWGLEVCPEIFDVGYTAKMEADLDAVELGEKKRDDVILDGFYLVTQAEKRIRTTKLSDFVITEQSPEPTKKSYSGKNKGTWKGKSETTPKKTQKKQSSFNKHYNKKNWNDGKSRDR